MCVCVFKGCVLSAVPTRTEEEEEEDDDDDDEI